MADTLKQEEFKAFERQFRAVKDANREARLDGVGLLTPELLRRHLVSKTPITLDYGRKGAKVVFSYEDLQGFEQALKSVKVQNRAGVQGMPLMMLENASSPVDKRKMQIEIRSAVLYKISGSTLSFRVSASGNNKENHHQVRVRLEDWNDHLTDTGNWTASARAAAVGRISFDCTCGRHQYWFRYLATISNCALTPKEKDFPKIRNPKLTGFCCKHTLKAFQQLKSGLVHRLLAKEMEKQAKDIGYLTPGKAKFLNAAQLAEMKRARGSDKDHAAAKAAYKDFVKARAAIKRKLAEPKTTKARKTMEEKLLATQAEAKAQKARAVAAEKALKASRDKAEKDAMANNLRGFLDAMASMEIPRERAIEKFAQKNNVGQEEVNAIVTEYEL